MSRLVVSIPDNSTADTLGLDPARYATNTGQAAEKQFFTFESQISDKERFKDVDPLSLRCPSCQGFFAFEGLLEDTVSQIRVLILDLADSTGQCCTTYRHCVPSVYNATPHTIIGSPA